ncbi:hypothetical protein BH23BAC1_BH23BAC1_34060 [soil metagenome]
MIKILACFIIINALLACDDKPDIQPENYQLFHINSNPANAVAYINVADLKGQTYTLQVFDIKGEIILEEKENQPYKNFELQLTDRPKGKYHIILRTDRVVASQELIKL